MSEPVFGNRYSVPGGILFEDDNRIEVTITDKLQNGLFRVRYEVNGVLKSFLLTQEFLEDCTPLPKPPTPRR